MSIAHWNEILQLTTRHPRLWIPVGLVGMWLVVKIARQLFDGWDGFLEALRYSYQPGWLSVLRGEFGEDVKAEFKLLFWFLISAVLIFGLKIGLTKLVVAYSLVERLRLPI
jgi:hypothetical protein